MNQITLNITFVMHLLQLTDIEFVGSIIIRRTSAFSAINIIQFFGHYIIYRTSIYKEILFNSIIKDKHLQSTYNIIKLNVPLMICGFKKKDRPCAISLTRDHIRLTISKEKRIISSTYRQSFSNKHGQQLLKKQITILKYWVLKPKVKILN